MSQILKLGSIGKAVQTLQVLLNAVGHKPALVVDGDFGEETKKAVMAFQKLVGLFVDGKVGNKTFSALNGGNVNRLLKDADLIRAAHDLGVPQSSIRAVAQVESDGGGYLDNGKAKILFERHVMYKQLVKNKGKAFADQQLDLQPAFVNTKRGGYQGGVAEYTRFSLAKNIDLDSAIESTSWGQFQVMGYHWKTLGYKSAQDFEQLMQASESNQFDAFIRFIKADAKLHKALKDENWQQFAAIYNGPAYKDNNYDFKLAAAKRHFAQFDEVPPAPKAAA